MICVSNMPGKFIASEISGRNVEKLLAWDCLNEALTLKTTSHDSLGKLTQGSNENTGFVAHFSNLHPLTSK